MADRPILFSGPRVRALLEGRKTQTRRVLKPQPEWTSSEHTGGHWTLRGYETRRGERQCVLSASFDPKEYASTPHGSWFAGSGCPYGQPGDLLWVRETFYCDHAFYPNGTPPGCYWDGLKRRSAHSPEQVLEQRAEMLEAMYYRADGEPKWEGSDSPMQWRSPIHMPRWASRLTLRITDVRVQRLADISEADALAEGITLPPGPGYGPIVRSTFAVLWDSINGQGSFDSSPWVWALTFDVIPRNIDAVLRELANAPELTHTT